MTPALLAERLMRTPWRRTSLALVLAGSLTGTAGSGRADTGVEVQAPRHGTLSVATYNVQFVTPDLPLLGHLLREWPGHKPNVTERAEAIAARLACFDVIALQETINDQRRREIFDHLEARGRTCGKPSRLPSGRMFALVDGPDVADGSWLPLVGNELALASRLPIVATGSHVYEHAAEEDVLAAKGVVHARLARGVDDLIDVFVTHLQAGKEHGEVRRRQIEELAWFIRDAANGAANPILVLGDFNVRGSLVDRRDPASDYNFLRRMLDAALTPRRFTDAWLATHRLDPDTASGTKPRVRDDGTLRPHEERIDHIFIAGSEARSMRADFFPSDLMIDGAQVGDLSDHAALLAEIELPGQLPSLTAQATRDERPRNARSSP
jgi:endonuclease/exonuclease/phosphatase family metal-dependent hydrolase